MQSRLIFKTLAVILSFTLSCPFPLPNQNVSRSSLVKADTNCLAPSSISEKALAGSYQKLGTPLAASHPVKLKTVNESFLTKNGKRLRSSGKLIMHPSGAKQFFSKVSYDEVRDECFDAFNAKINKVEIWLDRLKNMVGGGFLLAGFSVFLYGSYLHWAIMSTTLGSIGCFVVMVLIVPGIIIGISGLLLDRLFESRNYPPTKLYKFRKYTNIGLSINSKDANLSFRDADFWKQVDMGKISLPACTVPFFCDPAVKYKETEKPWQKIAVFVELETVSVNEYMGNKAFLEKLAVAVSEVAQSPVGRAYLSSLSEENILSMNYMGVDPESGEIYFTKIQEALKIYSEADQSFSEDSLLLFVKWGEYLVKREKYWDEYSVKKRKDWAEYLVKRKEDREKYLAELEEYSVKREEYLVEMEKYSAELKAVGPGGDSWTEILSYKMVRQTRTVPEQGHHENRGSKYWVVDVPESAEGSYEDVQIDTAGNIEKNGEWVPKIREQGHWEQDTEWVVDVPAYEEEYGEPYKVPDETKAHVGPQDAKIAKINEESAPVRAKITEIENAIMQIKKNLAKIEEEFSQKEFSKEDLDYFTRHTQYRATLSETFPESFDLILNFENMDDVLYFGKKMAELTGYYNSAVIEAA